MIQREGGLGQRADGQRQQQGLVIICRNPVGVEGAADAAAVDDGPLSALADPDSHRLHQPTAVGGAIPRLVVQMDAG